MHEKVLIHFHIPQFPVKFGDVLFHNLLPVMTLLFVFPFWGSNPRAWGILGKYFTTELHPDPSNDILDQLIEESVKVI